MPHALWPFALGIFGWFVANFLGHHCWIFSYYEGKLTRSLFFLWDVRLISDDRALREHQFDDAVRRIGKLGSRLTALKASLYQPLQSIVSKLGYDLDGAGRDLLNLS